MTSPCMHGHCPGPTAPGRPTCVGLCPQVESPAADPPQQQIPTSCPPPLLKGAPASAYKLSSPAFPTPILPLPGRSLAPTASDSAQGCASVPVASGAPLPASRGLRVTQPTTQPCSDLGLASCQPRGPPAGGDRAPLLQHLRGPSFSPVFWAARDGLRPSHWTLSPLGRPTLSPPGRPSPSLSGSLGHCCGLLLPRWGLWAWSCQGRSRKSLDPRLPRGQEAQPHFPSARVPFRPPEPGTLGRPPCGQAGGTHSQAEGQDTCARWRPHRRGAVCMSGKEEASVMQPTTP